MRPVHASPNETPWRSEATASRLLEFGSRALEGVDSEIAEPIAVKQMHRAEILGLAIIYLAYESPSRYAQWWRDRLAWWLLVVVNAVVLGAPLDAFPLIGGPGSTRAERQPVLHTEDVGVRKPPVRDAKQIRAADRSAQRVVSAQIARRSASRPADGECRNLVFAARDQRPALDRTLEVPGAVVEIRPFLLPEKRQHDLTGKMLSRRLADISDIDGTADNISIVRDEDLADCDRHPRPPLHAGSGLRLAKCGGVTFAALRERIGSRFGGPRRCIGLDSRGLNHYMGVGTSPLEFFKGNLGQFELLAGEVISSDVGNKYQAGKYGDGPISPMWIIVGHVFLFVGCALLVCGSYG